MKGGGWYSLQAPFLHAYHTALAHFRAALDTWPSRRFWSACWPCIFKGRVDGESISAQGELKLSRLVAGRLWRYYMSGVLVSYLPLFCDQHKRCIGSRQEALAIESASG